MKLIIAIIHDTDSDVVSHALTAVDFRVTQIASTGGFLRRGNTTLIVGVEDEQVEQALDIIRRNCTKTEEEADRRVVLFVLKVDQFTHF